MNTDEHGCGWSASRIEQSVGSLNANSIRAYLRSSAANLLLPTELPRAVLVLQRDHDGLGRAQQQQGAADHADEQDQPADPFRQHEHVQQQVGQQDRERAENEDQEYRRAVARIGLAEIELARLALRGQRQAATEYL